MDRTHIITIAGRPGSGKTTTGNMVAQTLGYTRFSSGDLMREIAKDRGMALAELQAIAATDHSIDDLVDGKLREIGTTESDLVIDSRLAFHWIPSAFKVFLTLDLDVAAHRIFANQADIRRTQGEHVESFEECAASIKKRFEWEQNQYKILYHIDPTDPLHYDLVLDTSADAPDRVADTIVQKYRKWLGQTETL